MKRITLFILLLIGMVGHAASADVNYELRAPNAVAAGDRFRIEFVATNVNVEKFTPPTFTGLDVLAGPITSTGMQYVQINGKSQSVILAMYTYTVQASTTEKRATISTSSILAEGGETYNTKATVIDIVKGESDSNGRGQSAPNGQNGTLTSDAVLLRMSVSKASVYKGEAIVASLRIYTQVGISGIEAAKMPAFNGFWKQELDMGTSRESSRETVGGKVYDSQIISQWLIYPQRSGTVEIEQTECTVMAQVVTQSSGSSLFDNFFGSGIVETVRRKITAPPVKITVKDLPQPAPASFMGAVGRFNLTSSISTSEVTANSGGSVILKLSGTGDFPLIEAPKIDFPIGFEKYDLKQTEDIKNSAGGTNGTRTWEYPFIARAEGEYTVPAAEMSYFDPATGKYVTLSSSDFNIKVLRDTNPNASNTTIVSGVTKEDLQMLGQDIRFIRTDDPQIKKRDTLVLWSATFFISFALIVSAFFMLLFVLKKQIRNRQDIVRTKNKKANGVALRRLKKAKHFMTVGNESGFYEEILRALWGYMGDKLAISVSDLNKERLREEFVRRGVNAEHGEEFLNLISECEMAQYSPVGSIEMGGAYSAALDLIGRLELK